MLRLGGAAQLALANTALDGLLQLSVGYAFFRRLVTMGVGGWAVGPRAVAAMRGRRRSREDRATNPDSLARTEAIDAHGAFTGAVLSIDDVHKQGVQHKAMWLHVLSSDSQLLLYRIPATATTCILRSQYVRKETDEHCARRVIRAQLCRAWPNWLMGRGWPVALGSLEE